MSLPKLPQTHTSANLVTSLPLSPYATISTALPAWSQALKPMNRRTLREAARYTFALLTLRLTHEHSAAIVLDKLASILSKAQPLNLPSLVDFVEYQGHVENLDAWLESAIVHPVSALVNEKEGYQDSVQRLSAANRYMDEQVSELKIERNRLRRSNNTLLQEVERQRTENLTLLGDHLAELDEAYSKLEVVVSADADLQNEVDIARDESARLKRRYRRMRRARRERERVVKAMREEVEYLRRYKGWVAERYGVVLQVEKRKEMAVVLAGERKGVVDGGEDGKAKMEMLQAEKKAEKGAVLAGDWQWVLDGTEEGEVDREQRARMLEG